MSVAADGPRIPSASEWQASLRQLEQAARWAEIASRRLRQLGTASREPVLISLGDLRSPRAHSAVQCPSVAVTQNEYWPRPTKRLSTLRPSAGTKAASLQARDYAVILYDVRGLSDAALDAAVWEVEHEQIERMDFAPVFVTDCLEFQSFLSRGYVFEYLPTAAIVETPSPSSSDWAAGRIEWLSAKWGAAAVLTWGRKPMRARAGAKVFVYPDYRSSNPYQQLMYPPDRSFAVEYADIAKAAIHAADGGTAIFHLHWEDAAYRTFSPARQSKARERFISELRQFKELGGVFIWTVHNLVPHDGVDPKKAVAFNRQVAALADIMHFHSQSAADRALREFGTARSHIRIIEHPSYQGAYPPAQPSDGVRERYGFSDSDFVLLCFGTVRPYKNLDALLEAVEDLPARVRVVIAGATGRHPLVAPTDRITVLDRPISPQELSDLFGMADFAVVPTEVAISSGTVMLALTMGTPVIVAAGSAFSGFVYDGHEALLFRPEVVGDLRSVVLKASDLPAWQRRAMRAAALATAAFHSPEKFAEQVEAMLREAIDLTLDKSKRGVHANQPLGAMA